MRTIRLLIVSTAFVLPWFMSNEVQAADVVVAISSPDDFYEPLSTQGSWVEVGSYGRCWHPYGIDATWRPYCEGTWVWTDQGWYWQSDESWSWACYHYGRWANDPYYGWVWCPDTVWGPSWVCFREGGGYCGWAPLPPGAVFGGNGELVIGVVPNDWFVFVGERHFGDRIDRRSVIINNTTIINRTTINTRITRVNNRVVNAGPRVQDLQKINHVRIQTGNVQTLRQHEKAPPIVHKSAAPQPILHRENEPVREPTPGKEPEIIRGPASAPAQTEGQEHREAPPAENKEQHIEQRPAGQPAGEKVAPQKSAPAHEEQHEEGGHGEEKKEGK